uniref:Uncharacterized protein n=1 Tax=Chromera velia CCMP2878 TaxID=1169474 RepID=A0A0K6S926_9ALVE|eukprot:Cvel_6843.t1-p1 / transcript=Cvel_6843.t1 / gene=Cvel_6843 / organism=Chromera_velia_CCMP2878 / gene_product=hypothetical protein / transcript_product=hypothetical protein / location=Cvel_scaffold345:41136-41552(-) / protein_length=139 / sequence_SO=supercontig / SO=protein_coding / is_pseudo=false
MQHTGYQSKINKPPGLPLQHPHPLPLLQRLNHLQTKRSQSLFDVGWMERSEFDRLCELGVVVNRNSWRVPGSERCWSVWLPSLSARALEGFNVKTFLEAMKRPLECSVLIVVEMASGVCLLASRDNKMYAVCCSVSPGI